MYIKKCLSKILALLIIIIFVYPVYGETIQIVTEEYPPYNFKVDGEIVGVSTEIVREVLKEAKFEETIKLFPWARAYMMAQKNENTIIYSISRTMEREKLFKWIGEIIPAKNCLYALKKRTDIEISKLDDAKKYKIGTVRDDAGEIYLISKGFVVGENIYSASKYEINIKLLLRGRIDLLWSADLVTDFFLKRLGFNPNDVKEVYSLDEISKEGLYMAFSKSTPDYIVAEYKRALEKIKKDGTFSRIMKKFRLSSGG